jgi:dipeptidyl aminopeptidase/acylaminoacyl peptidase
VQADFRNHPLFASARACAETWLRPGSGAASALAQLAASPDGRHVAAAASICDALTGVPPTRIALVDLTSGALEIVTHGPHSDSAPLWSPDGGTIAFLSDREQVHLNRLRLLDVASRTDRATPAVPGFVEYAAWSPDGTALLLGVAGYGSDLAGAQGAFAVDLARAAEALPAWTPAIEGASETTAWRSAWRYDLAADTLCRVTPPGLNVWQAVWCGPDHIAAICSDAPEETWWYKADVRRIALADGNVQPLFTPADQLGWLAASSSGATVAVVEGVCSDRGLVAGDLRLIDVARGTVARPATLAADVVQLAWRGEAALLFVGAQGPDTVIGLVERPNAPDPDAPENTAIARELWRGAERTPSGPLFPEVAPLGDAPADLLFLCESFFEPPILIALEAGRERPIRRFGAPDTDASIERLGAARDFSWTAPDGLILHGWLLTPPGPGPHSLILQVHGGPVWYARPRYLGASPFQRLALAEGYALFLPNPRGSSGRGQDFARLVFGDMGGGDTHDYLSGLDALERAGIADPARIGVTGGSYGGFVSAWLITQDKRFAAAVPAAPVTNWVSEHLTCNVPSFCQMFLADDVNDPTGKYFTRSPIHFAAGVTTPTLSLCGALDRITPPGQALEFHRALREAGVETMLATYPGEGHGVRNMPASFDFTARMLAWFIRHMPAKRSSKP